jgi:hypothetical protein
MLEGEGKLWDPNLSLADDNYDGEHTLNRGKDDCNKCR